MRTALLSVGVGLLLVAAVVFAHSRAVAGSPDPQLPTAIHPAVPPASAAPNLLDQVGSSQAMAGNTAASMHLAASLPATKNPVVVDPLSSPPAGTTVPQQPVAAQPHGAVALPAVTPPSSASSYIPPQTGSGSAILQKSALAYGKLTTYIGTTNTVFKTSMSGMNMTGKGTADIDFQRPHSLKIAGSASNGALPAMGATTFGMSWQGDGAQAWMTTMGKKTTFNESGPEMATAALTGGGAEAPTLIPAVLLKFNWGNPFRRSQNAHLDGTERVGSSNCYKVTAITGGMKTTFWIDDKDFLLRQYDYDVSDLGAMMRSLPQISQSKLPASTFTSKTSMDDFETYTIKKAV